MQQSNLWFTLQTNIFLHLTLQGSEAAVFIDLLQPLADHFGTKVFDNSLSQLNIAEVNTP